ncbi:MAG: fused MFS/spermidine synthase, partial [Myxococcota bacterium]
MTRDRSFLLLLLCFYLSGLAALVYETAWTRQFAFVFGTSELAVATVLAAYMGGLAFGAALASRYARKLARPVLAYGILELGIAIAALCIPLGIAASRWLYVALFGGHDVLPQSAGMGTAVFYLICSFAILLVPTAMMGATLPLLARHAVREPGEIGRRIGVLYSVNTAGAVSGVVLAAFWMLPTLGLDATIWAAAAINALVFLAAWALARRPTTDAPDTEAPTPVEIAPHARWILPMVLASGFVSFTYEVMWVRLLGHLVGGSVHAFATMLASFLAGIALGSAAASALATSERRATLGFAIAQLGIAALSIGAFWAANAIPRISFRLLGLGIDRVWADTAVCMLTLFPAALCIGATFPFAVRILAGDGQEPASVSGRLYAFNTVGSILGSIAAGFVLVPELGFEGTVVFCATVNLVLAGAAAGLFAPRRLAWVGVAAAALVTLFVFPPQAPWGMLRATSMHGGNFARGKAHYFSVGRSATVLLTEHRHSYALRTNGLPEAGILRPGVWHNRYPLPRWLSSLPVLARPDAKRLLVVGFGGGTALEVVPSSVERVDVVELEPEVIEANRSVGELRWRNPLDDPRIHVHLNDARNAL